MIDRLIIDSSVLVALFDESDVWFNPTVELFRECTQQNISIIVLDAVIDETISVLVRRFRNKNKSDKLAECFDKVNSFVSKEKIRFTSSIIRKHFRQILDLILESKNVLSFTDALIVHFIRNNNLHFLLSFDTGFDSISSIHRVSSTENLRALNR